MPLFAWTDNDVDEGDGAKAYKITSWTQNPICLQFKLPESLSAGTDTFYANWNHDETHWYMVPPLLSSVSQSAQIRADAELAQRLQNKEYARHHAAQQKQLQQQQEQLQQQRQQQLHQQQRQLHQQQQADAQQQLHQQQQAVVHIELRKWLATIRLSQYENKLVASGYDSVPDMKNLNKDDLVSMGMLNGHAVRLMKACTHVPNPKNVGLEALVFAVASDSSRKHRAEKAGTTSGQTPFVPLRRNEISQREEEERNKAVKIKVFFFHFLQ